MSDYPTKFSKLGILPVRKWNDVVGNNKPAVYTPEEAKLEAWLAEQFGWGSPVTTEIMNKVVRKEITPSFARKLALTY